jgi:hypothetical protein
MRRELQKQSGEQKCGIALVRLGHLVRNRHDAGVAVDKHIIWLQLGKEVPRLGMVSVDNKHRGIGVFCINAAVCIENLFGGINGVSLHDIRHRFSSCPVHMNVSVGHAVDYGFEAAIVRFESVTFADVVGIHNGEYATAEKMS